MPAEHNFDRILLTAWIVSEAGWTGGEKGRQTMGSRRNYVRNAVISEGKAGRGRTRSTAPRFQASFGMP